MLRRSPWRENKRERIAVQAVLFLDTIDQGRVQPLRRYGKVTPAQERGSCADCGFMFEREQPIRAAERPSDAEGWVHDVCPDRWAELRYLFGDKNGVIIERYPSGRGNASGCGHSVEGQPFALIRLFVTRISQVHSLYFCKSCALRWYSL